VTVSELSEQARSVAVGPPRQGFFYGWVIVWAGFVLLMLSAGITYSTPVLFRYFEADFGIGRGQAAFIFSFSQLTAFVIGPVAGSLAEKHGPRLAVGGGVALLGLGLFGASFAQSYLSLVICFGLAAGIGSGAVYVPLLGLIQRWFYRRRGLASGVATTGVSIGTLAFPMIAASAAEAFGWRFLYAALALVCISIGLLAAWVLVADPGEKGLHPDGAIDASALPGPAATSGMSLGEALRDRQFYLLYFCAFGAAVLSFMAFVHLPQHMAEASGDRMSAASIISVIGLASLASRLGGGSWADALGRVAMVRVALFLMLLTSILWLANPWGTQAFFVVAALFGVTYGLCIALLPTVIADSFGSKEISRIIGTLYTSFALAAVVGPTFGGMLRDRFGNYDLALMLCIALSALTLVASAGVSRRY
jgi:MFS transporter, OFA family, oxalate/formate antiporter